jgi:hypothetical protein
MHDWSGEDKIQALNRESERVAENVTADRLAAEAWGDRPGGVNRVGAAGDRVPWRAWALVAVVAAFAAVWLVGDNIASRIAGALSAVLALGLALRILKLRR